MIPEQIIELSHDGDRQALTIPPEFTLSSNQVRLRKDGDRLIIEPVQPLSLLALLRTLPNLEEEFPDVDSTLLPLDEIQL
jgi:antitoxin VapB